MKTSYFALQDKLNNLDNCVAISIGLRGYRGKIRQAKELCPIWNMLKHGYNYKEYIQLLEDRHLNPSNIYNKYKNEILVCWEKDYTKCHRRFIARWIKENLNIKIPEFKIEEFEIMKEKEHYYEQLKSYSKIIYTLDYEISNLIESIIPLCHPNFKYDKFVFCEEKRKEDLFYLREVLDNKRKERDKYLDEIIKIKEFEK